MTDYKDIRADYYHIPSVSTGRSGGVSTAIEPSTYIKPIIFRSDTPWGEVFYTAHVGRGILVHINLINGGMNYALYLYDLVNPYTTSVYPNSHTDMITDCIYGIDGSSAAVYNANTTAKLYLKFDKGLLIHAYNTVEVALGIIPL